MMSSASGGRGSNPPLGRNFLVFLLGFLLLAGAMKGIATASVEVLWQLGSGYADVFWRRTLWQWGIRLAVGVVAGGVVFLNLHVVSATLSGIRIRRRFGNIEIAEQVPRRHALGVMWALAVFFGFWFGASVPLSMGIRILLLRAGGSWGMVEPFAGRDASFYVFWLPVLGTLATFLVLLAFVSFLMVLVGYVATGSVQRDRGRVKLDARARVHLGVLGGAFLVFLAWRIALERPFLLVEGNSAVQGIFGYADAEARRPALAVTSLVTFVAGCVVAWSAWKRRLAPFIAALLAVGVTSLVSLRVYPALVQRFRVEPNELVQETPFIEANLEFTRLGFGLDAMERVTFRYREESALDWGVAERQLAGLPVWGRGPLLTTFREENAGYPYYVFGNVAIDRYPAPGGGEIPVAVAVREVEPRDPTWQNLHLRERYLAGMGAVVSLAAARTPEGSPPMVLSGIPPQPGPAAQALDGLELSRTPVFVGNRDQAYAVIQPAGEAFLAPDGTQGTPGVDFPRGIRMGSILRTGVIALAFRDANLLFSSELTAESRLVHRRNVHERVAAVAPFLSFPEPAYPVIEGGRIVWILEGFTRTRAFPLSSPHQLPSLRPSSWVRNSVKVTVDAVTGEMAFYRVPVDDPLADAYEGAFPGLFRPLAEMPVGVARHLRYPRTLLDIQAQVLRHYHQETARVFHGQQDVWDQPYELSQGAALDEYRAEYGIYALPTDPVPRFRLSTVFVPSERQNLTALLSAYTDDAGVPRLTLLDIPVEDQAPGPRQVEAMVEQDPVISQQFSLWRTGGSQVWTGHLHLIPVGERLVYMESVFLAAEADAIPQLRRFVVSDGRRVVLAESLGEAIRTLGGGEPFRAQGGDREALSGGDAGEGAAWSSEALSLLMRAEGHLRDGDWAAFGRAWDELRALLRRMEGGSGS